MRILKDYGDSEFKHFKEKFPEEHSKLQGFVAKCSYLTTTGRHPRIDYILSVSLPIGNDHGCCIFSVMEDETVTLLDTMILLNKNRD